MHTSIRLLHSDHVAAEAEAQRIEQVLARRWNGKASRRLAEEVLSFRDDVLDPALRNEEQAIASVIREHEGEPPRLREDEDTLAHLRDALARLEAAHRDGKDVRRDLARVARGLREYARFEETAFLPWAERELGDILLRETDARVRGEGADVSEDEEQAAKALGDLG